ncbi:hypothetical protein MMC19_004703 [Ptychographa xylographoides]|nr:hypothetical protein [Ptychographa xylographoides]
MPTQIFRQYLDAQSAFPPSSEGTLPEGTHVISSTRTASWSFAAASSQALALLSSRERDGVLRYHRPEDAAMALGSCLLKRLAVVRAVGVTWDEAGHGMQRRAGGKPIWVGEGREDREIEFNVSHHGGMVVLVADVGRKCDEDWGRARQVGIDVVKVDLVKDTAAMRREGGWEKWVSMFEDVFPAAEMQAVIYGEHGSGKKDDAETRLRRFYTHWCLREAYVKMTGEALVAPWLKELAFENINIPAKTARGRWGDVSTGVQVWLKAKRVPELRVELQAFGDTHVVATVVDGSPFQDKLQDFEEIQVERDIMLHAIG